jgi:hypothetical protein
MKDAVDCSLEIYLSLVGFGRLISSSWKVKSREELGACELRANLLRKLFICKVTVCGL